MTERASLTPRSRRLLNALPVTALALDLVVIVLAAVIAVLVRRDVPLIDSSVDVTDAAASAIPFMAPAWIASLALLGAYKVDVFGVGLDEYKRVLNASLLAAGLAGVGCYLARFPLSRGFFLILFGVGIPALLLSRRLLRGLLHSARRHGSLRQRVLIAGSRAHVDDIARVLTREPWLGYEVVGALTPEYDVAGETPGGVPVLGNSTEATSVARLQRADLLVIAGGALGSAAQLRRMVWSLEEASVGVIVAPGVTDISSERVTVRPVGGLPLVHIDPPTWSDASRWGKRTFDLLGAGALVLAFSPLMLFIALRVWAHDRGPVFFQQVRTGRRGEEFGCLKFRTMVPDAEARLAELHAQQGFEGGLFKMREDPRITGPGRWLRRLSLDELPQLFNVLRGEMSLVGPRPPLPTEVETYDDDTSRRLHVRPGMTGLWQVSGRSDLTWSEAVRLDLYYVDNWSMVQDIVILARTLNAVLASRGAY